MNLRIQKGGLQRKMIFACFWHNKVLEKIDSMARL